MAYTAPLGSSTGGIDFSRLSHGDIRKISVKRIHATPALDSMHQPVPGGLYDPALGAIRHLDFNCTTCKLSQWSCTGHPGHIELPLPCYHPQFIDTTMRLLRAKCVYCHGFRLPRARIHMVTCELRLLERGLVEAYNWLQNIQIGGNTDDEHEDLDDVIDRRERFVKKSIKKAIRNGNDDTKAFIQNPAAADARRNIIVNFIGEASNYRTCATCKGISPSYRKDRAVKIFRKPLTAKQQETMRVNNLKMLNPLLVLQSQEKVRRDARKAKPNAVNGVNGDVEMEDVSVTEHGAEEEIALQNAEHISAKSKAALIEERHDETAFMTSTEVHAALTLLFEKEQQILAHLFSSGKKSGPVTTDIFFIRAVLVPPNRYRPLSREDNGLMESQKNNGLSQIIKAANDVKALFRGIGLSSSRPRTLEQKINAAITLQENVNMFIDNPPAPGSRPQPGVKQTLEKKEGLFRMNMMGKRVNFAARSVISPDPNIETNEIGVPLVFAKKLTYPEPVTSHNFEEMSKAVINGCDIYPGAAAVENEKGQVMSLKSKTLEQRQAIAKQLLTTTVPGAKGDQTQKVYRHLRTGDVVIMNRQPTLHKPSMMGHRAKVLTNQKTIRMHYANCNTYNADFDGDEMNMHFPQNELARTEAMQIADTDHQYLSATAGKPLRGLIQDHISMGVQFTSRDTFFDADEYQQLIYSCLRPEDGHIANERLHTVPPAIMKPKPLWTGKQIITTVLRNLIPLNYEGINLTGKSSTSADSWKESNVNNPEKFGIKDGINYFRDTEQTVIFKDGEHLTGILDKGQLGPSVGGLVHSVYELYGHLKAGQLLSIIGRLLTRYLNERAWSCGMDDLYLTKQGDSERRAELSKARRLGHEVSAEYVTLKPDQVTQTSVALLSRLESVSRSDDQLNGLDQVYKSKVKSITDAVSKKCLPAGLRKPFPKNQMQAMTISGAKGSSVNANLISCNLGQQVLEGRRVPVMVSGKTLPSFQPYETDPGAGGYVRGRFLTGIKPHEYYFHAMSGREGLIDTAVKTAKSGYLQRCIVKGLEGARSEYDNSVRESSNGSVIQFLYGEDGLEVPKQKHLTDFAFQARNYQVIQALLNQDGSEEKLKSRSVAKDQKELRKAIRKGAQLDPLTATYPPGSYYGSTSERFAYELEKYVKDNDDKVLHDRRKNPEGALSSKEFESVMRLKYMRSVVEPGEAVGVVAAQSVGEPSTQMTLNTFHLAGHSAKNVTLGIPRLREIIMTATPNIMTPTMTLKLIEELTPDQGRLWAKQLSKLPLAHLISGLNVTERSDGGSGYEKEKIYDIRIQLFSPKDYEQEYAITASEVEWAMESSFLRQLNKIIDKEILKKKKELSLSSATAAVPDIGESVGRSEEVRARPQGTVNREGGEDDIDEDADPESAKDAAQRERREDVYDEPDEEEREFADASDIEPDDEDLEGSTTRAPGPPRPYTADDSDAESITSEAEARESRLKANYPNLKRFAFSRSSSKPTRIVLTYPSNSPKLLLLPLVEKAAHQALVRSTSGIGVATLFMEEVRDHTGKPVRQPNPSTGEDETLKEPVVTTEGVNLPAMWAQQHIINPYALYTNSVHDMLKFYGIEAARAVIIKEIAGVFAGHGISVDNRHINLIADAMTQSGAYLPFSRHGIVKESGSVLAKMSFETVMGFLRDAVLRGESDPLLGPSARIVAGRRGNVGTGAFDLVAAVA
jgi:DNA-directed RNA polymerase I subunit RPA1